MSFMFFCPCFLLEKIFLARAILETEREWVSWMGCEGWLLIGNRADHGTPSPSCNPHAAGHVEILAASTCHLDLVRGTSALIS